MPPRTKPLIPRARVAPVLFALAALAAFGATAQASPEQWKREWPTTDFSKHSISFSEIMSGGPPKDGIPSIDDPNFAEIGDVDLPDREPVIGLRVGDEFRAYPLRVLMWHEIVNDVIGGVPVTVTFCPLCNTAVVFDRRLDGRVLDFGTTGKLRNSDLVMYDRQTESWWQQFIGEAIVGELTGATLDVLPSRIESFARFRARAPDGTVLVPGFSLFRRYGRNPYAGYDSLSQPWLYAGRLPSIATFKTSPPRSHCSKTSTLEPSAVIRWAVRTPRPCLRCLPSMT